MKYKFIFVFTDLPRLEYLSKCNGVNIACLIHLKHFPFQNMSKSTGSLRCLLMSGQHLEWGWKSKFLLKFKCTCICHTSLKPQVSLFIQYILYNYIHAALEKIQKSLQLLELLVSLVLLIMFVFMEHEHFWCIL